MKSFRNKLIEILPQSSEEQRKAMAIEMMRSQCLPSQFKDLLLCEKTGRRFSWMISNLAQLNPEYLVRDLPTLWEIAEKVEGFDFKSSFTNYWRYCGVPSSQETIAINYLMEVLEKNKHTTTIQSRALRVMQKVILQHPDLSQELVAILIANYPLYERGMQQRVGKFLKHKKSELLQFALFIFLF
ncbi:hypothetical protein SAMN05216474_1976 [Lishizhenia tianjinensis]|uniref:DNA alkylation repair enzyme n=1 Tax=Lishizhenia tianjinensis TaxID=477690 RepID=A0A1I7ADC5_9FLAO|nr:hypothetical protein [Lishizhenia tianjinensis]SFT72976.1 hypothetical protein SAMN05216474_1976 [Lishizhenia tianjinensis]